MYKGTKTKVMRKSITTGEDIYLIQLTAKVYQHICNQEGIIEVLQNCEYGINYIKRFDRDKMNFKRTTKLELQTLFGWNTKLMKNKHIKNFLS